ncbi:MAG: sulfotransferase [Thermodesulfobacteriota bacterium]|nr:sulfotransferase [Thermodesulfobacteriota bacterium]
MPQDYRCVFLFGSPRSGTTLLQNILSRQSEIAEWYEPYYLWERFFPVTESDVWSDRFLTEATIDRIRREFKIYSHKSQKTIILDKSPLHAFNLKIVSSVFPNATFIHILRDGRDATLSIRKEWNKRTNIATNNDIIQYLSVALDMLKRQPYWRYRFMALAHELRLGLTTFSVFHPSGRLNKSRWQGYPGWGPRFEGWRPYLDGHSTLEFNAMQWAKSIEAVLSTWHDLPEKSRIEVRYEDLIQSPRPVIASILNRIGVSPSNHFFDSLPKINAKNFKKWQTGFSERELQLIMPILGPLLDRLHYTEQFPS